MEEDSRKVNLSTEKESKSLSEIAQKLDSLSSNKEVDLRTLHTMSDRFRSDVGAMKSNIVDELKELNKTFEKKLLNQQRKFILISAFLVLLACSAITATCCWWSTRFDDDKKMIHLGEVLLRTIPDDPKLKLLLSNYLNEMERLRRKRIVDGE